MFIRLAKSPAIVASLYRSKFKFLLEGFDVFGQRQSHLEEQPGYGEFPSQAWGAAFELPLADSSASNKGNGLENNAELALIKTRVLRKLQLALPNSKECEIKIALERLLHSWDGMDMQTNT